MSLFKIHKKEIEWGGKILSIETGKIGRQADGSVIVKYGETIVHAAVCASKKKPEKFEDFIPLTVNYQEKTYAAGRFPGGFFKREGKPSEYEILTSRLIDRPIRPLFVKGFNNETQVTATLLNFDSETQADIVAMIASSAALTLSGLPFLGPISGARVGYIENEYVLNPSPEMLKSSQLDLVVAGTSEGVLMVESEAKELSEDVMLGAVYFGHKQMQPVIQMIVELAEICAKDAWEVQQEPEVFNVVRGILEKEVREEIKKAYQIHDKITRLDTLSQLRTKAQELFEDNEEVEEYICDQVFHALEAEVMRESVLKTGQRIDGRDTKTIRPIESEVSLLSKAHGSALFTRGETQALVVATLGTIDDEQIVDSLLGEYKESFLLHYNFPPYSVGEVGRLGSPGRREIGHGKLAWRALHPVLPKKEDFPYSIRVVSEIMESNGSSSMATVCGGTLALMDAGVPITKPVAGIAMGLIKEKNDFVILSDIMGDEDHLGDMDFKVAGTADGITALQMDIKITSITQEIMEKALCQAKEGRLFLLGKITDTLPQYRSEISANAPRLTMMQVAKDKIKDVIGSGGKTIREIVDKTGAKIDIDDSGMIQIAAFSEESAQEAITMIKNIVLEPEVGQIYDGIVVKIMDFGAFVNFCGKQDGLVHISEIAQHRIKQVSDVLKEGDKVKVKFLGVEKGKIRLSMKCVDQETGIEIPGTEIQEIPENEHKEEKKHKHKRER